MIIKWFQQVIFFIFFAVVIATPLYVCANEEGVIEDSRTFHVYKDVDLVSTLKFAYGKPNIIIKIVYPQLASETERDGVNRFNELSMAVVQDEMNQFRMKVKNYAFAQKNLPRSKITNNLYVDYNTSFVKTKHHHLISIRFTIQGYITGVPHFYHYHRIINFNIDTGQEIELSDLFVPDTHYLSLLSNYTRAILQRKLSDQHLIAHGTTAVFENFQIWNIQPKGLLITFEKSTVAPDIQGAQTVFVPYSTLQHVISPTSPIFDCIKYKKSCTRAHLLTGGFIDEVRKKQSSNTALG